MDDKMLEGLIKNQEFVEKVKTSIKMNDSIGKFVRKAHIPNDPKSFDPKYNFETLQNMQREEKRREKEYKESVLNALQGIEKNTALLTEMTMLLQKSNDKQDELFELMVEILAIMKSANQEEADSKFANVMKKITTFTDNASTLQSLISMVNSVYTAYQSLPF